MKILQRLILVSICFIGIHFQSCCNCDSVDEYFDIQDMFISYDIINPDQFAQTEDITIPVDNFVQFRTEFVVDYISNVKCKHFGFSTMNTAWSCSCVQEGDEGSKEEKIENIQVKTLFDYNAQFSQNDIINEMMEFSPILNENSYTSLNNHLEMDTSLIMQEYQLLRPTELPTADSILQLEITLELNTGEVYTAISPKITFE